ncbi:hypothetical protein B7P43_G16874, partial [Cryptotermes secundus]
NKNDKYNLSGVYQLQCADCPLKYIGQTGHIFKIRFREHIRDIKVGDKNAYRILVGKPEGKRPKGRPRRRWVDNIRTDLKEIAWDGMDWIDLAQDRDQWRALVNMVMNLRVP